MRSGFDDTQARQHASVRWRPQARAAVRLLSRLTVVFLFGFAASSCSSDSSPVGPAPVERSPFATDVASAELLVSDISNFWTAYDEYLRTGSNSAFQASYLDRASSGLRDFINSRTLTASSIASMVDAYPRYFAGIRSVSAQLESGVTSEQVRSGYSRLKELYPPAVFPAVTFLIGRFSTGGTTANNRILIGSEFYLADPGVPLDELRPFQHDSVHPLAFLPVIIAHEHTHVLQQQAQGIFGRKTLLEQSILEGSADFIGELVSGGNINAKIRDWAIPREHALWVEFQAAMGGTDVSAWLYNQGNATADRPGDLGYFIGYRIAEAYFAKTANKTQAVKDIIEVNDAAAFLGASGYNP